MPSLLKLIGLPLSVVTLMVAVSCSSSDAPDTDGDSDAGSGARPSNAGGGGRPSQSPPLSAEGGNGDEGPAGAGGDASVPGGGGAPGEGGDTSVGSEGGTVGSDGGKPSAGGKRNEAGSRNEGGTTAAGTSAGGTAGSEPVAGMTSTAGAPAGGSGPSEAALRGEVLAAENLCASCHQTNYAGLGFYPNVTPDETHGIGAWTDEQIVAAIRDGVNAAGESLCVLMPRFALSDGDLSDLVAYLRSLPPSSNVVSSVCPGHGQ